MRTFLENHGFESVHVSLLPHHHANSLSKELKGEWNLAVNRLRKTWEKDGHWWEFYVLWGDRWGYVTALSSTVMGRKPLILKTFDVIYGQRFGVEMGIPLAEELVRFNGLTKDYK